MRTFPPPRDGLLWGASLLAALVLNAAVLLAVLLAGVVEKDLGAETGVSASEKWETLEFMVKTEVPPAVPGADAGEPPLSDQGPAQVPVPVPDLDSTGAGPAVPIGKPRFARTSAEQETSETPVDSGLIGERNTIATSERAPGMDGAALPSQAGVNPVRGEVETVDGSGGVPETGTAAPAPAAASPSKPEPPVEGADVVHVPAVPPVVKPEAPAPPAVEKTVDTLPENSSPTAPKTESQGSVSRTGVAARNVVETPLGRFEAAVTRAVETEWLRRCKQYQPYITPGYMEVRFVVGHDGKVHSVTQLEAVECTDTQRSFTNDSIRAAKLPPMPPELKRTQGKEPLALTIRFTFPETK